MKKLISTTLVLFSLSAYAQKGNLNVDLISYRVPIRYSIDAEIDPENVRSYDVYTELFSDWYRNKIGPAEYNLFTTGLYEAATTGKITVYDPFLTTVKGTKVSFTILSVDEVKSIGTSRDTTQISYPFPPYDLHDTVFVSDFDLNSIMAIDFLETWTINSTSMKMAKKIIAFAPVMAVYDRNTGILRGMVPMFWVKM